MKTKLLVAILLASATMLSAGTSSKLNLQIKNGATPGTIQIELEGLDQQKTSLRIQDISGKQWFSEVIRKQTKFSKTISIKALPSGNYLLLVNNSRAEQSRAFRLDHQAVVVFETTSDVATPGGLVLDAGGKSRCITRISAADAQTLRLHLSNLQEYQASVQLTAPDGTIRWEETINNQASFAKMIDLKALAIEPGRYVLFIKIGKAEVLQELLQSASGLQLGRAHQLSSVETAALAKQ